MISSYSKSTQNAFCFKGQRELTQSWGELILKENEKLPLFSFSVLNMQKDSSNLWKHCQTKNGTDSFTDALICAKRWNHYHVSSDFHQNEFIYWRQKIKSYIHLTKNYRDLWRDLRVSSHTSRKSGNIYWLQNEGHFLGSPSLPCKSSHKPSAKIPLDKTHL